MRHVARLRRRALHRQHDPRLAVVDTPSVKAIPVRGPRGFDAAKRVVGRKCVALVDADGVWLALAVLQRNTQDRDCLEALSTVKAAWPSLHVALLDGTPTVERCNDGCHLHGMHHRVIERLPGQRGFVMVEKRWVVDPSTGSGSGQLRRAGSLERPVALPSGAIGHGRPPRLRYRPIRRRSFANSKPILKTAA